MTELTCIIHPVFVETTAPNTLAINPLTFSVEKPGLLGYNEYNTM